MTLEPGDGLGRLTPKQGRFVEEYLVDLNATQAAIRAGYSTKTAKAIGHENLARPNLAQAIQDAMTERSKRTEVSQDRVVKELARIAFASLGEVIKWDPTGTKVRPSTELSEDAVAAISEVSETRTEHGVGVWGEAIRQEGCLGQPRQAPRNVRGGWRKAHDAAVSVVD